MVDLPEPCSKGAIVTNSLRLQGKNLSSPVTPVSGACDSPAPMASLRSSEHLARVRECGGIGRRAGFRYQWVTPCEFESRHSHKHLDDRDHPRETRNRVRVSRSPQPSSQDAEGGPPLRRTS